MSATAGSTHPAPDIPPSPNMAFLPPTPIHPSASRRPTPAKSPLQRAPRAAAPGPEAPKDFKAPQPRLFFVRPDKLLDFVTGSAGLALRAGAGSLVDGYRVKQQDGKLVEYSSTLPNAKPRLPIKLFEFEACPYCRKVREAVTMLDLDVVVFPCPKDGTVYREYVRTKGGKTQFPYIEDPNTGFESYESDAIIRYLYMTYGPSGGAVPFVLSGSATITAGLAQGMRKGKGRSRVSKAVPAKQPIEFYGYESSPFSKLVREKLCELELPYYMHSTPRGSPTRAILKEKTGRFQAPYIEDPNTGISMFESAEICEYLMNTYGPSCPGAVEVPSPENVFMPDSPLGAAEAPEVAEEEKSLDPTAPVDDVLEAYCEDNPETDECRVYED